MVIYQNRDLEESDYLGSKPEGERILFSHRRFVLGQNLIETSGLKILHLKLVSLENLIY